MKTAQKIANVARGLFNENGVSTVTIRQIANELGISSGNLNYHFKTRRDIVEFLYFEMVEEFDKPINNLDALDFSITNLFNTSLTNFRRMVDYRFIWIDLHHTLKESEKIKKHFIETRTKRVFAYDYMLQQFVKNGTLTKSSDERVFKHLAKVLTEYIDFWISSETISKEIIDSRSIQEAHQTLMMIFSPYLTPKGKKEMANLMAA